MARRPDTVNEDEQRNRAALLVLRQIAERERWNYVTYKDVKMGSLS